MNARVTSPAHPYGPSTGDTRQVDGKRRIEVANV